MRRQPLSRKVEIRPTTHEEHAGAARDIDRPRAILDNTHAYTDARRSGRAGVESGRLEGEPRAKVACGLARRRLAKKDSLPENNSPKVAGKEASSGINN